MNHCGRIWHQIVLICLLALSASSFGATKIVDAVIATIDEHSVTLTVGGEAVITDIETSTRFWHSKGTADLSAFRVGESVKARLKTDKTPIILREIADKATWDWLDGLRKHPTSGVVRKVDDRCVTLALTDGSNFSYRVTAKTPITLNGTTADRSALKEGMKLWIKGRTLPTLDTWAAQVSDQPILVNTKTSKKGTKRPNLAAVVPAAGKITGNIMGHWNQIHFFDLPYQGLIVHIGYNAQTRFTLDKRKASPADIVRGMLATATFHRDALGRIIATKVELFSRVGP